ncbi:MAG: hypothetical protein SOT55_01200 [Candidatus Cryptobacteroides sp.]|nr:hypothetical protein [Candidatus Cryptobacteroides sp.]
MLTTCAESVALSAFCGRVVAQVGCKVDAEWMQGGRAGFVKLVA